MSQCSVAAKEGDPRLGPTPLATDHLDEPDLTGAGHVGTTAGRPIKAFHLYDAN